MTSADLLDLILVGYALLFLPLAVLRSARALEARRRDPAQSALPRLVVLRSTTISLLVLLVLGWTTIRTRGWDPFWSERIGVREVATGAVALALHFVLRAVVRAWRTAEERSSLPAVAWTPRTTPEWSVYALNCVLAGIAEELVYRGLVVWILGPWIGLIPAILVSATAFAISHAAQKRKAATVIFGMALTMHGLVEFTGTLVVAMVVHTTYDLLAGWLFSRELGRRDR